MLELYILESNICGSIWNKVSRVYLSVTCEFVEKLPMKELLELENFKWELGVPWIIRTPPKVKMSKEVFVKKKKSRK